MLRRSRPLADTRQKILVFSDPSSALAPLRPPRPRRALVFWLTAMLGLGSALGAATAPGGEQRLAPGSPDLHIDHLRPFEAVYADRRGNVGGSRTHRLDRLTVNQRPSLRFTITMHGAGVVEDELVFDAESGLPLARRIFAPNLVHRVETWEGGSLRWVDIAVDGSGSERHDKQFDMAPLTLPPDLLVATLALEPGDRRFVRSFSTDLGADAPGFLLDVLAEARETVTTPAGRFDCLRVRTEMRTLAAKPEDAAPLGLPPRTLWIHSEPPYLVRATAEMAGTAFVQELEEIRWIGPTPEANTSGAQADVPPAAAPHDGGLLHRLVDWFHGIHGNAHP